VQAQARPAATKTTFRMQLDAKPSQPIFLLAPHRNPAKINLLKIKDSRPECKGAGVR
jgi:hypothetical protein